MDKLSPVSASTVAEAKAAPLPVRTTPKDRFSSFWVNYRAHLIVIALYAISYVIFTWPLALHLTDQSIMGYAYLDPNVVPVDRDQIIWDMWWVKKALLDLHVNPYHTGFLFYPYGVDLYLHALTPVNGLLGIFFESWLGWLGAYNVVCLILYVWCGHAAYLLANYLLKHKTSAFVAGFFFTFAPTHLANLNYSQSNGFAIQFVPLFLLYLLKLDHLELKSWKERLANKRWWRYSLLVASFLILATLSDQYLLLYCLIITTIYYLWQGFPAILKRIRWPGVVRLVSNTLPSLLLAGLVMLPFLYRTWKTINSGDWSKTSNYPIPTDLLTILLPPAGNIFVGSQASEWGRAFPLQGAPRELSSIGLVTLVIGVYGLVRAKELRFWGLIALVTFVLALGGDLEIGGNSTGILLPAKWLNDLPVFGVMRYSRRWLCITTLCLAIGVAWVVRYYLLQVKAKAEAKFQKSWRHFWGVGLATLILALFIFEAEPWPNRLVGDNDSLPKAYATKMLPQTDHRAILELPIVEKTTAKYAEMYWQTAHERPIVGGYLARPYNLRYENTPFAFFLDSANFNQPDILAASNSDPKSLLDYYNFGYIAIYKTKTGADDVEQWRKFVTRLNPDIKLYYEDSELILYQLPQPAANQPKVPLVLLGPGWSSIEKLQNGNPYRWITAEQADLWFITPSNSALASQYTFQFQAAAYYRERNLEVLVNDQPVARVKVGQAINYYKLAIDGKWFKAGENIITFHPIEPPDRPTEVEKQPTKDSRPLSILLSQITYEAK